MAAGPWIIYNAAKRHLADGSINLSADSFRMALFTSASNATDLVNLTAIGSVTGEVTEGFGYSSSGKPLTGVTWAQGASAGERRFNSNPVVFTAIGGNITGVKYAVIFKQGASAGACKLLCRSQLSASQFTVLTGNTHTVAPSVNGIFVLR
jgi:hypothetical protein